MSGTMRERSPGTWELRVYTGRDATKVDRYGKPVPRQVSRTVKGGKRAAQRALDELVAEVRQGNHPGTSATFGKLLDDWLAVLPSRKKAPSTIETYSNYVRVYIRPALGGIRLSKLTARDLDHFYKGLSETKIGKEKRPMSVGTIRLIHGITAAALNQGVKWGWIRQSPSAFAEVPAEERHAPSSISIEDFLRLLALASSEDPEMAMMLLVGAFIGGRRGELCGLQWGDVNWSTRTLSVERQWVPGKGGQSLGPTKTKEARDVHLGDGIAIFAAYRERQTTLFPNQPMEGDAWLISYDGGRTPLRAKSLSQYVTGLGKRLDPPVTLHLHSLRHTMISTLMDAGIPVATVAERAGHRRSSETLDTYTHPSDPRGLEAANLLAGLLMPGAKAE